MVLIKLFDGKLLPGKDNSFPTSHIKLPMGLYHRFFWFLIAVHARRLLILQCLDHKSFRFCRDFHR